MKKPGHSTYQLLKNVTVSATGAATYKYKCTAKGTWSFRVKFLGDATYLAAPAQAPLKVTVK